ncbi:alpha/beta-hydrolase [Eremomyces bilateralis CBS 781.70]|uniref:Alpha/beta-hydrolase n=1 Tax=Eremomyces bilateralis CBS 781.70 TaxID=1392243 RepID=A0A6G1FZF9_9PEZI|nr:alpha/beta-hydrolase [Eremomyces bilateralis CBS 781.70]KAF1811183.1 alpha/beta-hydrolase [Eremomyces bilateralis CBS 781.70]
MSLKFLVLTLSAAATVVGQAAPCSPLEMIYAKATGESGQYGIIVGNTLVRQVLQLVPSATGYSVPYPADFSDRSPELGVQTLLQHLQTQVTACPDQKFALSGYSQGAVVLHRAAVDFTPEIFERVVAAVTFGDGGQQATAANPIYDSPVGPIPKWPEQMEGKYKFNCVQGDLTCTPGGSSTLAHLRYNSGSYISDSAKFVAQQYQKLGGSS